jgi:hypothetical protein
MEGMVGCLISNIMMCMEDVMEQSWPRVRSDELIIKISPLIIDTIITLLLNYHIFYNHASSYDLPHIGDCWSILISLLDPSMPKKHTKSKDLDWQQPQV